jgi:hypothetical protein
MKQRVKFADLPIGLTFTKHNREHNPVYWIKASTRTARMGEGGKVFFFGQTETVWTDAIELAQAKRKTQ